MARKANINTSSQDMSDPKAVPETVSLQQRFTELDTGRQVVIDRAQAASALTIPSLFPEDDHSRDDDLPTPYQGLGARGVNNLSSKLLLSLLPPSTPFFMLSMDEAMVQQMNQTAQLFQQITGQPAEAIRAGVDEALIKMERIILDEIDNANIRTPAFRAMKLLVTTGECMIFLGDEGPMKVWKLDQYVVKRDFAGNILEFIIREQIYPDALDEPLKEQVITKLSQEKDKPLTSQGVDLYTRVWKDGDIYRAQQEVMDFRLDHPEDRKWTDESLPYFIPRWVSIDGEDHGRGHVEEYIGDLRSLEVLSRAIVVGSAAAAKTIFLVNKSSGINIRELANTESGGFVGGDRAQIGTLQVDKFADFRVAAMTIDKIEIRLSHAFLLNAAVQRNAERVTAEEIRFMAQELEDTLGGVFSNLSQEFQLPLLRRLMKRLEKAKKLPPIPKESVRPTIITGLQAIGRGHDLNKLRGFILDIAQLPQTLIYINISELVDRMANGHGIDPDGLVKSQQEVQQELQQQQQAQLIADSVPGVAAETVRGLGNVSQEVTKQVGQNAGQEE